MLEESLTSLAVLKVNWDQRGKDYVDNFIPFVAEALRRCPQDHISVAQLQEVMRDSFGLVIPQGALNTLLRRSERYGYVRHERGVYLRVLDSIPSTYSAEREAVARQQRALIDKLVAFCRERHSVKWTTEQAEAALLVHLQKASVPILAAAVAGSPLPEPAGDVKDSEFLVSSFIIELHGRDPDGFGFLETVMKGHMLATALFLPDISKANQKFDDLEVFIDTRLLLRALGFEGDGLKIAALELLTLLYRMNINLRCFDITLDETRRVLDAAQHALRDQRNQGRQTLFAVYEHFLSLRARPSDIESIMARLEELLRSIHVRVKPKPEHTVELGLNERRLEQIIDEEIPAIKLDAKRHDIDSLTSIHRLRKGNRYSEIERSKFIFLTSNIPLARASARFFKEQYEGSAAPLCINDHMLATLAWVKNPSYVADFSKNRLIADSYVALSPSPELWRRYSDEVSRLKEMGNLSDDEYQLLRYSLVARKALMETTLGNPEAFTEGTVEEVLERAQANIRKGVEDRLKGEVEKREAAESEARNYRARHEERLAKISSVASAIGRWCGYAVYLALMSIFVVGFYATLPSSFPQLISEARYGAQILIAISAVVTVWSALEGGSIRALSRRVEVRVSQRLELWFRSIFFGE